MKVDGYRVISGSGEVIALYVPEFHQVWTNPRFTKSEIQEVLCEEFIHATQTTCRPSELLPLRNYLMGTSQHPRHAEFRDIVESVYLAAQPLAFGAAVDLSRIQRAPSPYRDLGIQMTEIAIILAHSAAPGLAEQDARKRALWAVILTMLNCVPRARNQAEGILTHLRWFQPRSRWTTSRELFAGLLTHLASVVQQEDSRQRRFTVVRPNDSHTLLIRAVDILHDALQAPAERLVPVTPVLLSVLTMDIYRTIHLVWQRRSRSQFRVGIEVWPFTLANIAATRHGLQTEDEQRRRASDSLDQCAARSVHVNWLVFLEGVYRRRPQPSLAYLMHEAVELFPHLLRELVVSAKQRGCECETCRTTFRDPVFASRATSLTALTTEQKVRLVNAAYQYGGWLRGDCLRLARTPFGVPARVRSKSPIIVLRCEDAAASGAPPTFCCAGSADRPLAQFLPALGQIWILPDCPDKLFTQIQAHEVQHHNDCSLQPAQLLHLRHVLLDRPLPEPYRFHDLMEASYVFGLTIAAGFGPNPRHFPPALAPTRRLAMRMAQEAMRLAKSASPAVNREVACTEAAHALLFLLHHVVPSKAGLGEMVLQEISCLMPVSGWHERSELWASLHVELQKRLGQTGSATPFQLALPIDPHRSVGEMLVFLAHCLQQIPERRELVMKTLPAWVGVLSFGSIVCIPVIRMQREGNSYKAAVSILHADDKSETAVQKATRTQATLLSRWQHEGVDCTCTRYVVRLFMATQRYRLSTDRDRIRDFLSYVMGHLAVADFLHSDYSCASCKAYLLAPTVREAAETIKLNLPDAKRWFVDTASLCETWLSSGCIDLFQKTHQLPGRIRVCKQIDFL